MALIIRVSFFGTLELRNYECYFIQTVYMVSFLDMDYFECPLEVLRWQNSSRDHFYSCIYILSCLQFCVKIKVLTGRVRVVVFVERSVSPRNCMRRTVGSAGVM